MRALILALLLAGPAMASGYVEAPAVQTAMTSFADCLLELEGRAASDIVASAATPIAGQTITLVTDGVQVTGDEARYQSDLWYHNHRSDAVTGLNVTSHSYMRILMICDGAMLIVVDGRGYTLDTFE